MVLGNYFEDAKASLETAFGVNQSIAFSSFNSPFLSNCVINGVTVEHFGSEDSDRANMRVFLQFQEYDFESDGTPKQLVKIMNLLVLNSEADIKWTKRMRTNVWNDRYPTTVAIDMDTAEVYLLFIESYGVELRHFAKLKPDDLEALLLTLDENAPFYIFIDSGAMFDVLDGAEGYSHLLNNLFIVFKGARKVRLNIRSRDVQSELREQQVLSPKDVVDEEARSDGAPEDVQPEIGDTPKEVQPEMTEGTTNVV